MEKIDDLQSQQYESHKDSALILQLLKDNLKASALLLTDKLNVSMHPPHCVEGGE